MQRAPFFDVRVGGAAAERRLGRDDLVAAVLADVAAGRLQAIDLVGRCLQEAALFELLQIDLPGLHFLGRPHRHGFAIGYACNHPERLGHGLAALGQELRTWR